MSAKVGRVRKPAVRRVREGSAEPRWVSREQLEAIHAALLGEHGGATEVRDEGLVQSALARARNKFAYGVSDLATLAAAYAFGLARNHGFVDGNKRTAFQAMYVFLGLNGHDLDAPEPEVVDVTERLANGKLSETAFADWIRSHMRQTHLAKHRAGRVTERLDVVYGAEEGKRDATARSAGHRRLRRADW